ncbi:hypothetical protein FV242_05875 [Methylobacterium sp. WL64]|uniref:hypothetical protein n=1 Tax=Methylobacterium sp. WL64 TaxID=2603894 RepID=UPI0011C82165|nr:hypothetical protein [Methylobacterium sp. WL64]TXN04879.1 hypothetical protein FV242_05875 [Methylobacterium sp. WL64]
MPATHDLILVRKLAGDIADCEFFRPVLRELGERGLDAEDLLDLIREELDDAHFRKCRPTLRHYEGTTSDYYSVWVEDCGCHMFLKFLIHEGPGGSRLVITSFKRDDSYDV